MFKLCREVVGKKKTTFVLDTMCRTMSRLDTRRYWKTTTHQEDIERAISINGYIYNRTGLLNMMRRFTEQRELLRPTKTRFATAFITLSRINEQRNNLRKMFTSSDWIESKWANEQKGKNIANIIFMSFFWNTVVFCLKVSDPLVRVLRLVDSEKRPLMGYIYAAMKKAKEIIVKSFNGNEEKYREIIEIIDRR